MILEIAYNDDGTERTTDPYDGATHIERDEDDNLVVTWDDGTRQTFIDGRVVQAWEDHETHVTSGN